MGSNGTSLIVQACVVAAFVAAIHAFGPAAGAAVVGAALALFL